MVTKHCPYCGRFISHFADLCDKCKQKMTINILTGILVEIVKNERENK